MLGGNWRWLRPLARRYVRAFDNQPRPRERDVITFLLEDKGFRTSLFEHFDKLKVVHWMTPPQRMQPVAAAESWDLPPIESLGALAGWLGLTPGELEWFADLRGQERRRDVQRLRHYHYQILVKLSGRLRLIEAPKTRLKQLQQRILAEILEKVPAHSAAHGFVKGRSIKTFVTPHVQQRVVLRTDLQDFFPCLGGARIQALFRTLGYPESVAGLLAGICTNSAPKGLWAGHISTHEANPAHIRDARALYSRVHLPQGAPTSPMLANLAAYRMDCRLAGLARSAGARYTRYADDLAFSGGEKFEQCVERFSIHVAAIVSEEGFAIHHRKTRIMRQSVRQHLAGLVANQKVNVRRTDFDRLKAILTNCVRFGPESQNRDHHPDFRAHLEGRISFVEMIHVSKGERLRKIFDQIEWE